jgi:DNA-binding HxlR family transcriptional regulator
MQRTSFESMNCSVAQCLEVIGEWWTPLILRDIFMGVSRFDHLQARLGIARNILADRLNRLIEKGVLEKVPYQANPERFDYKLTEKGYDLWRVLTAMREWGDRWAAPDGPTIQLVHRSCGHVTSTVMVCGECGEALERSQVRLVPGPGAARGALLPE